MNLKRPEVVSDLTGVTGMQLIQAILRGEHDPVLLATYRERRCQNSEETIAQALDGSYRDEHLCALQHAVDCWACYHQKISALDVVSQQHLQRLKQAQPLPPRLPKPRVRERKPNGPRFDVRTALYYVTGVELTAIEGIDALTALTVRSEIGTDMTRWATVKHVCSWLGLCPPHKQSGGKIKSSRTRPGVNRAAAALCVAASSLHRNQHAMGAYFRRMKRRLGTPKAVTATAHTLARILYHHCLPEEHQSFTAEECICATGLVVVPHLHCVVIRNKMSHCNLLEDLTQQLSGGGETTPDSSLHHRAPNHRYLRRPLECVVRRICGQANLRASSRLDRENA